MPTPKFKVGDQVQIKYSYDGRDFDYYDIPSHLRGEIITISKIKFIDDEIYYLDSRNSYSYKEEFLDLHEKSDEILEIGDFVTIRSDLECVYYMGWFVTTEMKECAGQTCKIIKTADNPHKDIDKFGKCSDFAYRLEGAPRDVWWTYDMFEHEEPEPFIENEKEMSDFLKFITASR